MISIPKGPSTARTLPTPVGNQVGDAGFAEDVAAEFDHRVTEIGVADGADGNFLSQGKRSAKVRSIRGRCEEEGCKDLPANYPP